VTVWTASYLAAPAILHETIDDETIILDPTRGWYYSLERAGAEIWSWLQDGASPAEIVGLLTTKYAAARDELTGAVRGLVTALEAEGLIVGGRRRTRQSQTVAPVGITVTGPLAPFTAPSLEKYTDLEGLVVASAGPLLAGAGVAADEPLLRPVGRAGERQTAG
jgi:coenzyme PQQ synthesis protein D (PqqD)